MTSQSFWPVVALLSVALAATSTLGALEVIGEDNTVRLVLGLFAAVVWAVRERMRPGGGGGGDGGDGSSAALLFVGTLGASELAGTLAELVP